MNITERYSYLKLLSIQYKKSSKKKKGMILDEVVRNLGYNRKHAIALLSSIHKKDLREKFSLLGYRRSKSFSWEKTAEETLGIYK